MRCLLFRRMNINGVNYYQLYKIDEDFHSTDEFGDYDTRGDKEFFYIENDDVTSEYLYTLFYDNEGVFEPLTLENGKLFVDIYNEFKNKYQDVSNPLNIKEIKNIDEMVDIVSQKVLFEKKAIRELIERLYTNQLIVGSNLPDELKRVQKRNILLHGPSGTGKKTIMNLLKENLDFPCTSVKVDIKSRETAINDLNYAIGEIFAGLMDTSANTGEISNGIVFIEDNFKDILEKFDGDSSALSLLDQITKQGVLDYKDVKIDFGKLTFVILYDEEYSMDDIELLGLGSLLNCQYHVPVKSLTNSQKYNLLLSSNGRIAHYADFLNLYKRKFYFDDKALKRLIKKVSIDDKGMNTLNKMIDMLVKENIDTGIHNVYLDDENVDKLLSFFSIGENDYEDLPEPVNKTETITKNVLDVVVGQDDAAKKLIYHVKKNLEMANKKDLDYPEKYIKKILLRGETGSGKSLLLKMIARNFNVPIYIADATKFTETGYVGSSINDMLLGLIRAAHGDLDKAQRGILIIDEIDKKSNEGSSQDISRGAVQNELLTVFDGATIDVITKDNAGYSITIPFDTSRLTIIASGAFEDIEKIRDRRLRKQIGGIGFNNTVISDDEKKISSDDYVNYGMMRQLMGRMPIIIYLNKHDKNSIINICKNSSLSPLKIEKTLIMEDGIEVEYQDDFYPKFAEKVLSLKIGARGIERALQDLLSDIHIEEIDESKVEKIIFTGECVDDPTKVILVPKVMENVKLKKLTRKS